jgi:uncharacterized protein (TIRG00374 family)
MTSGQRILVLTGILLSGVFLWLAFSGLNPGAVWHYVQQVQVGYLLLGVLVFFASMVLIAWRWGFLLRAYRPLPLGYLSELVSIAYMGNNVYPLRAGEFLRVFLLQNDHGVPVARTTTTIFIERIFDGFVMLAFIVIPLRFIDIASPELEQAVQLTTPIFLMGLIVFLILALNPAWITHIAAWISRLLPSRFATLLNKIALDVVGGMEGLREPRYLLGAIVGSVATWLVNAAVYWVVAQSFDLEVSYAVTLLITGAVNLAGVLPASPGQIGVFEFFVSAVLMAAGVGEALAIAYALVVHVVIWLPPTLLGFFLLVRRGFGLRALVQTRQTLATGQNS